VIRLILALAGAAIAACATTGSGRRDVAPAAATAGHATAAERQHWLEMFARGYFPGRSGQVFVVANRGDMIVTGDPQYRFQHGSPWDYDAHVPLLVHGAPFVRQGEFSAAAHQQDVAPTIGALIGAPASATYSGRILTEGLSGTSARPRVVTLLVLDAMRADYFDRHAGRLPTLTRLRREGAWFANARTSSMPTVTGVGHASLGTGTDPRVHGIVVNNLFNRATGKVQEAYDRLDVRELMALTLADLWNLATAGRAVIIGHGGAIRATAGLVGRGACLIGATKVLAASYGGPDGGWETNPECYAMPDALKGRVARPIWEAAGGQWMGHDISNASRFRASALFQRYEAEALRAVVEASAVGEDEITDLVLVNLKGPDYTSHMHGPDSPELAETLAELDRQIAAYLSLIDQKAGPGRSVTVVTADHGMAPEPPPGRRFLTRDIIAAIHTRFDPEGRVVQYYGDPTNVQLHLDTARLASLGHSLRDVAAFLEGLDMFAAAFTEDDVGAAHARRR
jgi:hypothetical protein